MVKDVVTEFVENRESDRLGLVVFGEEAFTQCPLTLDHNILLSLLDKLAIGIAGDSTAIGSAIGIAVKRLKDLESESKVIILLTDGRNNAGDLLPLQAAEIAKSYGIKIYTIGVGTRGKAPFLVDTVFGKRYMYQEVDIDEDTLKKISTLTGAKYFRATDLESLKDIYQQIDRLEKTEVKVIEPTNRGKLGKQPKSKKLKGAALISHKARLEREKATEEKRLAAQMTSHHHQPPRPPTSTTHLDQPPLSSLI